MNAFLDSTELKALGLKKYGENVLISRNAILYSPELLELGDHVRIDDFVTISGKVIIGSYIHVAQFCCLYGGEAGIYLDDFSSVSSKSTIYVTTNDYSGESMTNPMVPLGLRTTDINAPVHLCKHAIIGCSSVILPGVTIGTGSALGSMSFYKRDLPAWGINAGCPARKIRDRSKRILDMEKSLLSGNVPGGAYKQELSPCCALFRRRAA